MSSVAYINGKVLHNGSLRGDLAVIVNGKVIESIIPHDQLAPAEQDMLDLAGSYLLPGFIDTQVNGGGAVLFNDSPNIEGIKTIARAHRQFGTTGLLPTLISDNIEVIQKGLAAVNTAIEEGVPGVLGIHIEGPFINGKRRGIHEASKVRKLTTSIIDKLEPVRNAPSVLTVAPELLEPGMIRHLTEKGFIVCAGHSDATCDEVSNAVQQGLRGFTHLFNAMSQLGGREPGMVGAALDHDETWCGIIVDGHHVSPTSLRVAYRCKGAHKLLLVTDAMPPVGSSEKDFCLLGNRIVVRDGVCVDAKGTLAGTALDMASAVRNVIHTTDCGLVDASVMASASPSDFLGLQDQIGALKAGMQADFVILDEQLNPIKTIIGGQQLWSIDSGHTELP